MPGIAGDIYLAAMRFAGRDERRPRHRADHFPGQRRAGRGRDYPRDSKRAHPTVVGEFRITRRGHVCGAARRAAAGLDRDSGGDGDSAAGERRSTASAPKTIEVADPGRTRRHDRERRDSGLRRRRRASGRARDRGSGAARTISASMWRSSSASIICRIVFRPKWWSRRRRIPAVITEAELEGRRDFRDLPIVTIDGETARDFDDAVLVDKLPERPLRAAGAYRRREPLRAARARAIDVEARMRGHQRLFSGSRGADAAVRAFDQHLFAEAAGGPAGDVGADRVRSAGRAAVVSSSAAA